MRDFAPALAKFAADPESDQNNLDLADLYAAQGQTAAAITYYTRTAERTTDLDLAYACLILAAQCFDTQGHRHLTVRSLLKRAIVLHPRRPEAYWYLAKFNEYFNQHSDCYLLCNQALEFCSWDSPPLPCDVGYPGDWIFLLERGISAWWYGCNDQTRDDFRTLIDQHWHHMPVIYRDNLLTNMHRTKMFGWFFQQEYQRACDTDSDINQHLPKLRELALQCSHITEMGVRHGTSTRAWLNTDAVLRSYDIWVDPSVQRLFDIAQVAGKDAVLQQADVLQITIDETDLLFIDTAHQYQQLRAELSRHSARARRWIVLHDTTTFGYRDDVGDGPGLMPALEEFLDANHQWRVEYHTQDNNGLMVLRRHES